ncbi:methyltransferase type 11 [Lichtheimia corymbifera JMRC:FSU:9682]|uniref:Methyltransferase type 11 n=1 Tax=Lichtheimia corymbifera JMRC:FSU:9682 TaxID=1263082 RepID=A0A068S251_9FUNG|nr:methyltransferase type 11 [Lichtheimia corymbifera JMRC:FSU:9682]
MGNQTSRVIEKTKERRSNKVRRRSTATLGTRSHSSVSISQHSSSHGNYDWIETQTSSGSGAIDTAVAVATVAASSTSSSSSQQHHSHYPNTSNNTSPSNTHNDTLRTEMPRRKSISEVLNKRKGSFSRTTMSQDDFREYDRLQRQHYLLKSARKTNAHAPIQDPVTILDLGTAGGIWALEMAAMLPNTQVIGIDIKPPAIQQQAGGPKNLKYIQANINENLPMSDNSVDYIFQRSMGQVIRKDKWQHVLSEMYRILRPGGYIELVEADLWHHNPGPVQQAFDTFMQEQCTEWGLDFVFTETLSQRIEEAGFDVIEYKVLDIPIGEWPKDSELKQFGFINKETQKAYLRNRKQFFTLTWGISSEDYDMAVQEVMEEFEDYHGFTRFNCWIAKKA